MDRDTTAVSFVVYDYDKDFESLTNNIGIRPSKVHEEDKQTSTVRYWEISSGADETDELEKHLDILLKILEPATTIINEISKHYRCVITAGIHYKQYNPEIMLSPQILRKMSDLGVKLWIDMYTEWDGKNNNHYHDYSDESKL